MQQNMEMIFKKIDWGLPILLHEASAPGQGQSSEAWTVLGPGVNLRAEGLVPPNECHLAPVLPAPL